MDIFSLGLYLSCLKPNEMRKALASDNQIAKAFFVRLIGLEPTRRKTLDPKSSASTNFATSAFADAKVMLFFQSTKIFREISVLHNISINRRDVNVLVRQ